ncbi:MarR family winged helix-turn-helix transcriptional regulator [Mycobacterium montefiorense]|uniref:MarR family transcriptional regulator n=1 Tax=Mycobacterium montefiorense TaxID=154654 RepID=A0AA37PQ63_9MYCO|nr:MarR family transcriptional regulator [Mycobacterium montefiorense]GBG37845.1 MarR family transcriptional regulator [Mycobacterium montefiorense]GKU34983.1 MarR family transcriptional regulator [Mycobacterium montefiorense]GKU40994.1 MarR family transcriptional regulator [Mycobacterium montefiorense]GKU47105.1 MarR family transcriptional regulator [Mycobacterium montefiorense]GKU49225.1 MarR family transcriptional regulator [Mycobacterium montefiorense]
MQAVNAGTDRAADAFGAVGRFRRQLRRSVDRGFDSSRFTESQSELLWLVGRRPGISVRAAAGELGLVPNTASTMVSKLVANGLLVRTVDQTDRRACQLRLAEPTQQIVDASRAARRALLSELLDELNDDQIDSLAKGLEVLDMVARRLQER